MRIHEYECQRCFTRFEAIDACEFGTDPVCPVCGSTAVVDTACTQDDLDVLRTRGAGSGGG